MKLVKAMADTESFIGNTYSCFEWAQSKIDSGNYKNVAITTHRAGSSTNEKKKVIFEWRADGTKPSRTRPFSVFQV